MPPKTICIDFDGVIHSYISPFTQPDVIPDPPVPGAFDFIRWCLAEGFRVAIFSTRNSAGLPAVRALHQWFERFGFDKVYRLSFPDTKPAAFIYIDDRGFCFRGQFPTPEYLANFKPWNRT